MTLLALFCMWGKAKEAAAKMIKRVKHVPLFVILNVWKYLNPSAESVFRTKYYEKTPICAVFNTV